MSWLIDITLDLITVAIYTWLISMAFELTGLQIFVVGVVFFLFYARLNIIEANQRD